MTQQGINPASVLSRVPRLALHALAWSTLRHCHLQEQQGLRFHSMLLLLWDFAVDPKWPSACTAMQPVADHGACITHGACLAALRCCARVFQVSVLLGTVHGVHPQE